MFGAVSHFLTFQVVPFILLLEVIAGDSWGLIAVPVIEAHPATAFIFVSRQRRRVMQSCRVMESYLVHGTHELLQRLEMLRMLKQKLYPYIKLGGGNSNMFYFHPYNGEDEPILTVRIFFRWLGFSNHQPASNIIVTL